MKALEEKECVKEDKSWTFKGREKKQKVIKNFRINFFPRELFTTYSIRIMVKDVIKN